MTIDTKLKIIHIAVFECLRLEPQVAAFRGQFGDVFRSWLQASAAAFNSKVSSRENKIAIETSHWDVEHGQYPETLEGVNAIIVSGSTASAYDKDNWITTLEKYLQDVYNNTPRTRIFGGCFGHQLLAQALLGNHGVYVEKSPEGWEIGVHEVVLASDFKSQFPSLKSEVAISCQFLHADHVVLGKEQLPEGWVALGSSNLCDVQGIYQAGRVLTYQGHPEFDSYLNEAAVLKLGEKAVLSEGQVKESLELVNKKDDAVIWGVILLEFITTT